MNKEELEQKINRIEKLSTQKRFTIEEFREMETYLKEIRPNWNGCAHCPAQINFGQTILTEHLNHLRIQLNELPLGETMTEYELPPIPVGEVIVTSECSRCKKKNKRNT